MISLAILAGGRSDRMGRDKALMPFLGKPLIQYILERLYPLSEDIVVVTNRPADYSFLNLPLYQDIKIGYGPLGGVFTALQVTRNPFVAIIGCDMPFASRSLFEYEYGIISSIDADIVIPSSPKGIEPLHAIYRKKNCLPVIKTTMINAERKLIDWFPRMKVHQLTIEETEIITPNFQAFTNLNTLEEFQQFELQYRTNCLDH